MTTPQPAALPEPFAWAWHNKVTGAKGVYFEDPQPFGVTSHPDYEWTHLYNEAQVLAALRPQSSHPVIDVDQIINSMGWGLHPQDMPEMRALCGKVVEALRPQAVPMTDEIKVAEALRRIKSLKSREYGDNAFYLSYVAEMLETCPDCQGNGYGDDFRECPTCKGSGKRHGITAQGAQGEQG